MHSVVSLATLCLFVFTLFQPCSGGNKWSKFDCADDCDNLYGPNTCGTDKIFYDNGSASKCSDCCQSIPGTCNPSASSCCSNYETMCSCNQQYTSKRTGTNTYTKTCDSQQQWWSFPACAPNYNQVNLYSSSCWASFCVADNCGSVPNNDCTKCQSCIAGYQFVTDGSCQPPPTFVSPTFIPKYQIGYPRATMCTGTQAVFGTDPGANSAVVSFAISLETSAKASGTGANAVIQSLTCTRGGTNVYSNTNINSINPTISFDLTLALGTSTIVCTAKDNNNMQTSSCSSTILIRDLEAPIVTSCGSNIQINTLATTNYGTYAWSRSPTATDNVAVTGKICGGGPSNNNFLANTVTTITCAAWDAALNNGTCTYTVRVTDVTAPTITCQANPTVSTLTNVGYAYVAISPTSRDNVQVASTTCSSSGTTQFPMGNTLVTCTVTDTSSNTAFCSFTVKVIDTEVPRITCPSSPYTIPSTSTGTYSAITNLNFAIVDNVAVSSVVCTQIPGNTGGFSGIGTASASGVLSAAFPLGSTIVKCNASDSSKNSAVCSTTVVVTDAALPIVTCANVFAYTQPGHNYTTLSSGFGESYYDNVGVVSSSCTPPSTAQFSFGTTSVTCSARDAANNLGFCSFVVTVADNQPPQSTCPSNIVVATNLTSPSLITIPFLAANATDNVRINYTLITIVDNTNISYPSTSVHPGSLTQVTVAKPEGTIPSSIEVTFNAYDTSGNTAACGFSIFVIPPGLVPDSTPPVINGCPTPFLLHTPPTSDYNSALLANVTIFNVSALPSLRYANLNWTILNASDDSGFVLQSYMSFSPTLGNALNGLAVGRYVVAYQATDRAGNSAYCAFKIQVLDLESPRFLNCPQSSTTPSGNSPGAVPPWPSTGIVATDNFEITNPYGTCVVVDSLGHSVTDLYCPPVGSAMTSPLPVGAYTYTYTAVDTFNNKASCSFTVTIQDTQPPTIPDCVIKSVAATVPPDGNVADISTLCPVVNPTDNVGVVSVKYTSDPPGNNCSTPIPVTLTQFVQIYATASDAAGLETTCTFIVTVTDVTKPIISGSVPTITATCDADKRSAVVSLPTVTATDNSGTVAIEIKSAPTLGLSSGSAFPFGTTTISYLATDPSGNVATATTRVVVSDTQPPRIDGFPGSPSSTFTVTINTDPSSATGTYTIPNITAWDNVGVFSASYLPSSFASLQSFPFPIGPTLVTFNVADMASPPNTASVSITVIVVDNEAPVFSNCPTAVGHNRTVLEYYTAPGLPTAQVTWNDIAAVDNVDGARTLSFQTSNPPGYLKGSLFYIGLTTITYTAIDTAGNTVWCTFDVLVKDIEPPRLDCPSNITEFTDAPDINTTRVSWRMPITSDNSNRAVTLSSQDSSGSNFTVGEHLVEYLATDASGNNNTCAFGVIVKLQAAAVVTLPPAAAASSASIAPIAAGAAGGAIALLVLLVLLILVVMRRNHRKKMQAANSGYAELLAMSDEFVLQRALAIQTALTNQRAGDPPAAVTSHIIHPTRKFAPPPKDLDALQEYIRTTVNKEISRTSLEFLELLGQGEFGEVHKGNYIATDIECGTAAKTSVAIKMLKNSTSDEDKVRFLKEAAIMAQFDHPNIVALVGVCTLPPNEPTLIVLEFMSLGSLQGYLQNPMVKDQLEVLTMIRFALDICAGMQYLAEAGFVHRDLATRNILMDENMNCRVGDFGLSVDLAEGNDEDGGIYSGSEGAKIPVRWTALEAITFRQFSSASDAWSFGVVLWEIWSYADLPYKGWNNRKVIEQVTEGYRLPKPSNCPDEVYRVMIDCWNKNAKRRATFPKINTMLVQAWKDTAKETLGGIGPNSNLYDTGDDGEPTPSSSTALYDVGGDDGGGQVTNNARQKKGGKGAAESLYDMGGDECTDELAIVPKKKVGGAATGRNGMALYDVGGDDGGGQVTGNGKQGNKNEYDIGGDDNEGVSAHKYPQTATYDNNDYGGDEEVGMSSSVEGFGSAFSNIRSLASGGGNNVLYNPNDDSGSAGGNNNNNSNSGYLQLGSTDESVTTTPHSTLSRPATTTETPATTSYQY